MAPIFLKGGLYGDVYIEILALFGKMHDNFQKFQKEVAFTLPTSEISEFDLAI